MEASINDLPVECLEVIFKKLHIFDIFELRHELCVNKWREATERCVRRIKVKFNKNLTCDLMKDGNYLLIDLIVVSNVITSIEFDFEEKLLWENGQIFEKYLIELFENCRNLRSIHFRNDSLKLLGDTELLETIANKCLKLKKFRSDEGLPENSHKVIKQLVQLETLQVYKCNESFPKNLQFKKLKRFSCTLKNPLYVQIGPQLQLESAIFQKNLIELELTIPSAYEGFDLIFKLCPNLKSLALYNTRSLNQFFLNKYSRQLHYISKLKFRWLYTKNRFENEYMDKIKLSGLQYYQMKAKFYPPRERLNIHDAWLRSFTHLQVIDLDVIQEINSRELTYLKTIPKLQEARFPCAHLKCQTPAEAIEIGQTILECRYLKLLQVSDFFKSTKHRLDQDRAIELYRIIHEQYRDDKRKSDFKFVTIVPLEI